MRCAPNNGGCRQQSTLDWVAHILMHVMSRRFPVFLAGAIAIAQADALFSFHSNAWLNLHHILWSKGEGAPLPADMPEAERTAWAAGIEVYAPYSKRNLLFDDE